MTVTQIADALGISSAHISLIKNKKRRVGRTVRCAMIRVGWLPAPPRYPYFKINRFDAERAADQIINTLGDGFAETLSEALARRLDKEGIDRD